MKTKFKQFGMASLVVGILVLYGCKKDDNSIDPPGLPAVTDASLVEITVTSAVIKGVVLYGKPMVKSRGICWSSDPEPTVDDSIITEGSGPGEFSGKIAGLNPGTRYYVRIFASNTEGTVYSKALEITTPSTASPATVVTNAVTYISATSALAGGKIISNGNGEILEKGVCWSTESSPTVDNSKVIALNGSSAFNLLIGDLDQGTVYYVRAYAINSAGLSYGPEVTYRAPSPFGRRMSDIPGDGRFETASFSIGNKIYLGPGYDSRGLTVRDFWEWDRNSDQWTRMADLPVYTVRGSTSFTIGAKGYILVVTHNDEDLLVNELWEFDPGENQWTRMADFPETPARLYATGFSIGAKAYIGLGMMGFSYDLNQFYDDFWEWDQASNTWTRKGDFPGSARAGAAGFSIGTKGYVGTGDGNSDYFRDGLEGDPLWYIPPTDNNGLYGDFWEYDQASDTWTRKADFTGSARKGAIGFSVGNKGYIGLGLDPLTGAAGLAKDVWEWDQPSDTWTKMGDFVGTARTACTGGSIGNMGYLAGGFTWDDWETGFYSILVMNDLWLIDLAGTE